MVALEKGEHVPLELRGVKEGRKAGLSADADLTRLGCLSEEDRIQESPQPATELAIGVHPSGLTTMKRRISKLHLSVQAPRGHFLGTGTRARCQGKERTQHSCPPEICVAAH